MMMTLKNILISVFLFTSVSFYLGHDIVYYYSHISTEIENTNNGSGSQRLISSESSSEEEVSFIASDYSSHFIDSDRKSDFPACSCVPPRVYLSIWLPPDNS
jgi:hypothetical protein